MGKYNSEWKSIMHRVIECSFSISTTPPTKILFWSYRHVSPFILKSPKQFFFNVVIYI